MDITTIIIAYIFLQLMFFALVCSTYGFGGLGLSLLNPKVLIREGMNGPCGWIFGILFNLIFVPYALIYWTWFIRRLRKR